MGLNKPVEFSTAKLLKEKGFDEDCYRTYSSNGKISPFPLLENMGGEPILNPLDYKWKNSLIHSSVITAPTIAEVVMWLLERSRIWITVTSISQESWQCHITKKGDSLGKCYLEDFYTPTEAYEAAIEYCLNKLYYETEKT